MAEIRLRPGASLAALAQTAREQATAAENAMNTFIGKHPKEYLAAYLGWVNEASRMLGNDLHRTQFEELLHTRHYWALRQMDGGEAWLTGQIKTEMNAQIEALNELADEADRLQALWNVLATIVVPDTNILLHTTEYFDELDWSQALDIDSAIQLVIPMVVVDQIDSLKRSKQPVRSRARQTANRLEACLSKRPRAVLSRRERQIGIYSAPGPITTVEVLMDPLDHSRLPDSDSEIVDRALYLQELTGHPVLIATWDNLMRFRARGVGVETVKPGPEYEQKDEP
jgi:PIN domain